MSINLYDLVQVITKRRRFSGILVEYINDVLVLIVSDGNSLLFTIPKMKKLNGRQEEDATLTF